MKKRKKKEKTIIHNAGFVLAAGLVVLVLFLLMQNKNSSMKPYTTTTTLEKGEGVLSVPIAEHDFGTISLQNGVVSKSFPLVNIGEGDLTITFLDSSCGCTSAKIVNGNQTGPIFGMSSHGKSPRDWKTTIRPGEKAQLVVYYDPSVHPKFRGSATRIISIYSNDKSGFTQKVKIRVNQVG